MPIKWNFRRSGLVFIFLILSLIFIVAFINTYIPCTASGISMEPTVYSGEHFFIDKKAYSFGNLPQRGDLIVFKTDKNGSMTLKRVLGIPGDQIRLIGRDIAINNLPIQRRPVKSTEDTFNEFAEILPSGTEFRIFENKNESASMTGIVNYVVPANEYFVVGDNRDNAHDSRNGRGYILFDAIVGKAGWFFNSPF